MSVDILKIKISIKYRISTIYRIELNLHELIFHAIKSGKVFATDLKSYCLERGINEKRFHSNLKRLIEKWGEVSRICIRRHNRQINAYFLRTKILDKYIRRKNDASNRLTIYGIQHKINSKTHIIQALIKNTSKTKIENCQAKLTVLDEFSRLRVHSNLSWDKEESNVMTLMPRQTHKVNLFRVSQNVEQDKIKLRLPNLIFTPKLGAYLVVIELNANNAYGHRPLLLTHESKQDLNLYEIIYCYSKKLQESWPSLSIIG